MTDILLIDLSSVLHPLWHLSTDDPDPNATSTKTVERVRALASGQPYVAVCIDSPKSFRRDIEPTYKAQRVRNEPLQHQMRLAIETLRSDGFPVWGAEGFEADDVIASACSHANDNADNHGGGFTDSVTICSADKDLLQLVGGSVVVKSLTTGDIIDAEAVRTGCKDGQGVPKFGISPEQICDWLCLVGDASDNIKGADKVGPKTATGLLKEFGSLDMMFAAFDAGATPTLTPNLRTRLQEFRPRLAAVRSLIRLRTDVPVPFDEIFKPRTPTNDVAVFGGLEDPMGPDSFGGEDAPHAPSAASIRASLGLSNDESHIRAAIAVAARELSTLNDGTHAFADAEPAPKPVEEVMSSERADLHVPTSTEPTRDVSVVAGAVSPSAAPASQALARQEVLPADVSYERQLEPKNLAEAYKLSVAMSQSRLFSAYGNPDAVLATVLAGREFGMPAIASLRAFHVVDGKPTLAADTIRALVLRSGAAEYFRCTERSATRATFATKRKGEPEMTLTFTIEEGRIAWPKDEAAWTKSGWGKNPADMLVARAGAKLARLVYPDVVYGIFAPEELQ